MEKIQNNLKVFLFTRKSLHKLKELTIIVKFL